jgi:glycosyltransferase involved in cell wall biosynthesis
LAISAQSSADAFIFPSYREGLSVSVMEAMVSGLPCAVSRIRGNTDLITDKGGAFFNPHSTEECVQAIREVLDGDMMGMGQVNRDNSSIYSMSVIISIMKSIYES